MPLLALERFAFTWPDAAKPTLAGIDLSLAAGECVFVGGASGCGKTTLLRALAGLLPGGPAPATRHADGSPAAALLLQNVDSQLLASRVADEVDFGLALRGLPADERARRAERALGALGLGGFASRSVDDLSAGEKQRTILAALLALEPAALLLDEPSSQLDPEGRRRLAGCLRDLKRAGHAIALADHLLEPWSELVDRRLVLEGGRLRSVEAPSRLVAVREPAAPLPGGRPALVAEGLRVDDSAGRPLLHDVSLRVASGECVYLGGANGAGKSTLLRVAAGLVRPSSGRVQVCDDGLRPGRVGLLFQNPERNLFERTVEEEVAFALRRFGWRPDDVAARVRDVLGRCGLAHVRERSPLRLSFGEQHRVALASVLAPRPRLLLLDEPFAGLDLENRARVLDLLHREQQSVGFALLVASHDPPPAGARVHRRIHLVQGRVVCVEGRA